MEQIYGKGKAVGVILRGLVLAGIVSAAALMILALLMLKLQPDTNKIELGIMVTYALSCLLGGWYGGRKMERKKYLWGLLLGALYFLLLFAVSGMGDREVQPGVVHSLAVFVLCSACGMLGGMIAR